jgi:tetratricopeptide (TPR) repeat protein
MPLTRDTLERRLCKLRAALWNLLGRPQQAEAAWTGVLQRWPQDAHALASRSHLRAQQGRSDEAIADAQALLAKHPGRSAADAFNLAFLLEQAGQLPEAEQAFRQALALDEQLDRAWYGLGLVLVRLGRSDEAVVALRRNTELQPMSPYGWYQLARLHATQAQPEQALKIIRHLKGFEPRVAAQLERETGLAA